MNPGVLSCFSRYLRIACTVTDDGRILVHFHQIHRHITLQNNTPGPHFSKEDQDLSPNVEHFQIGLKPAILQLHAWNFVTSSLSQNVKHVAEILQVLDQFDFFFFKMLACCCLILTHKHLELTPGNIGFCHHCSKKWPGARSAPCHFLNQCWFIID